MLASTLTAGSSREAAAYHLYTEASIGVSQPYGGDEFFRSPTLGYGLGASYGAFGKVLEKADGAFEIHLGLLARTSFLTTEAGSAYFVSAYPALRLQVTRVFVGVGVAPVVWKSLPSGSGTSAGSLGFLGEAGFLWPVVPHFSLGIAGTGQSILTSGSQSPKLVADVALTMRFYMWQGSGKSGSSSEFKGWRYPRGIMQ